MKLCFIQFYLFVAGLIMLLVGGFIALAPNEYLMSMGVQTEMAWRHSALLISTMVFTAFVIFRTTGFVFEGFPSTGILIAYFVELVIALVGVFSMKTRRQGLEYVK